MITASKGSQICQIGPPYPCASCNSGISVFTDKTQRQKTYRWKKKGKKGGLLKKRKKGGWHHVTDMTASSRVRVKKPKENNSGGEWQYIPSIACGIVSERLVRAKSSWSRYVKKKIFQRDLIYIAKERCKIGDPKWYLSFNRRAGSDIDGCSITLWSRFSNFSCFP